MEAELEQIHDAVGRADQILITSQLDPDGDSVGSQLALRRVLLTELGPDAADRVHIVNEVACPPRYSFLPEHEAIVTPDAVAGRQFDLGFVLDGGADRTGSVRPLFEGCATRVLVDHHKTTAIDDYSCALIDPHGSSTAELIYRLIESDRWKAELDETLATWLYVGLVYDTGCFMYALTTPQCHHMAARLMQAGIDHSAISERVLLESPLAAKKLLALVLEQMQMWDDGRVAWCIVTPEMEDSTGASDDDVRATINHLIFIRGVVVALLFKVRGGRIKISLRARDGFDVANFARSMDPGGGGHARAAGFSLDGTLQDVASRVLEALERALS